MKFEKNSMSLLFLRIKTINCINFFNLTTSNIVRNLKTT